MATSASAEPVVGEDRSVVLPDGRTVVCWAGGDPSGSPVLFHSGTPSGRLQATLGHEAAVGAGVRLLAFNRPGYGGSSTAPPGLALVGADELRVLDAFGVDRAAVMGVSGGGPYALATALAAAGRVTEVVVVAGIGPWTLIEDPDPDDPERPLVDRAMAGDLSGAADGFLDLAREEFRWLTPGLSDDEVCDGFFAGVPPERLAWLDAEARRRWAADTRDALGTFDGYVRDNLSWAGAWDLELADLRVPCRLVYGADDHAVPPSHGRWLRDRIPSADLVVQAGDGHGEVIFGRLPDLLADLALG